MSKGKKCYYCDQKGFYGKYFKTIHKTLEGRGQCSECLFKIANKNSLIGVFLF